MMEMIHQVTQSVVMILSTSLKEVAYVLHYHTGYAAIENTLNNLQTRIKKC